MSMYGTDTFDNEQVTIEFNQSRNLLQAHKKLKSKNTLPQHKKTWTSSTVCSSVLKCNLSNVEWLSHTCSSTRTYATRNGALAYQVTINLELVKTQRSVGKLSLCRRPFAPLFPAGKLANLLDLKFVREAGAVVFQSKQTKS